MPRILDNIDQHLLPALRGSLSVSKRADFCVGYFNLRGWKQVQDLIETYPGTEEGCCRVLVGMQKLPQDELREALSLEGEPLGLDKQSVDRLRRRVAEEFRQQLALGAPTESDEQALRRLARQLRAGKTRVRLTLSHPLHAKLYLAFRDDPQNPAIGYVGSSNLTFSGLLKQGELNVDVLDADACDKLSRWFDARWSEQWCLDISIDLAEIIEQSWARETPVPPWHIYLKMAWHLSREARQGVSEFRIPKRFEGELLEFQARAVQIAANHLNKRHGVLIGDVVGLGKTRIGAALARMFEDDHGIESLIICPKNLVPMWERTREQYGLRGRVLALTQVARVLPNLRPYHIVLIDESHNLRNRAGQRYRALLEYLRACQSRVVLLSATPYNKHYVDLSNQLRLFLPEDKRLPCRPMHLIDREYGGNERLFESRKQCLANTLQAFEHSTYSEDWRDLLRHYMVRRTRSFILDNYAPLDEHGRHYVELAGGKRAYFPLRAAKTLTFGIRDDDPHDQYGRLYSDTVVDVIGSLTLPRYGLGNYQKQKHNPKPGPTEQKLLDNLTRAGRRLMGFCRTNLFKRLESSGASFVYSIERHILRNYIYLHAIENGLDLPIGTQDATLLDPRFFDDEESQAALEWEDTESEAAEADQPPVEATEAALRAKAVEAYRAYQALGGKRFKWLGARFFRPDLAQDLEADAQGLLDLLLTVGAWRADADTKLDALADLIQKQHGKEKLLVFTQFADTARYLETELKRRGVKSLGAVTGDSADPTGMAVRFSPVSNEARRQVARADEFRVLIATDVLSEGQNLQDAAVVVNYDLPWAIIRLIQRAGRVDRIGQQAERITCYTFLPAEGVERIIRLRARVRERLHQNAEVIGTDETFFEEDLDAERLQHLYHEETGVLDDPDDDEVDLSSYAWQIWNNATRDDEALKSAIETLPNVVYSAKDAAVLPPEGEGTKADGVLVYLRTADDNDALAWLDPQGQVVTESQLDILRAAACAPDTPARPRGAEHHALVKQAVAGLVSLDQSAGGNLGRPSGPRARTYERLKHLAEARHRSLFPDPELELAVDDLYRRPLKEAAWDTLHRQLKAGVRDEELAELAKLLREEGKLTQDDEELSRREPQIICSLGLV
ncbi:MAG: helicase-related protein [Pseudomonadota bacterium]|nr:helicase-related protein [Pseudomonadota bacterium]